MTMPYFYFKNIISTDYLTIDKLPPIIKANKDIQKIEIEGRDGFLTQDLGSYRGVIKNVECWIKDLKDIDFVCSWLDGSGDIIFSNEPDKVYKATIINQIPFSKTIRDYHKSIIIFESQPHKYSLSNDVITLEGAGTIYNNTGTISKPIIKVFASGSVMFMINSQKVTLTDIIEYVEINSNLMDAYKGTQLCNNQMIGNFPNLEVGNNIITWSGTISKIEIKPNWRYL